MTVILHPKWEYPTAIQPRLKVPVTQEFIRKWYAVLHINYARLRSSVPWQLSIVTSCVPASA